MSNSKLLTKIVGVFFPLDGGSTEILFLVMALEEIFETTELD